MCEFCGDVCFCFTQDEADFEFQDRRTFKDVRFIDARGEPDPIFAALRERKGATLQ